jgi:hypothetical protein
VNVTFEMSQLSACPVCKGRSVREAIESDWGSITIHYSVCDECGQLFLNPRMSDKQTTEYYTSGLYRDVTENGINDANLKTQQERANKQYELISDYLGHPRSNLEIGCSAGCWLEKVNAPDSQGVEPDERYHSLPASSKYPMVTDIAFVDYRPFDLISMSHVLEHFNHPLDYLTNLVEHYAGPHSRFMIEVPNADFLWGMSLNHPMAFNLTTLSNLFTRVDYKPIAILYHGLELPFPYYLLAVFEKR